MGYNIKNYVGWKYHIKPKYDHTSSFSCGRAYVEKDYKAFFISTSGKIRISHSRKRETDSIFQEDLVVYATNKGYGFLNKVGKVAIPAQFAQANGFFSGRSIIMSPEEKFGVINKEGNIVVDCIYEDIQDYSYGLASFKDKLYGYLDRKGDIIIEPSFIAAGPFIEGLAKVLKPTRKHKCFINTNGEEVFNTIKYEFVDNFSEGFAAIRKQGLYGYIDTSGEIVISPKYIDARPFCSGLAAVKNKEGLYGYINLLDRIVIPHLFQEADKFIDGLARVKYQHGWGLINRMGLFVVEPQFTSISSVSQDLAAYCVYGGCGYIKLF